MDLDRTPLLTELARPSVSVTGRSNPRTAGGRRRRYQAHHKHRRPKKRTRKIAMSRVMGNSRRDPYARIERRTRENSLPSIKQILRSRQRIKEKRRASEVPLIKGHQAPRTRLLKGLRI